MIPESVWVPAALASGAAVVGLLGVLLRHNRTGIAVVVAGLVSAAAFGGWQTYAAAPGVEVGWFIAGGGHTSLPALMYALTACAVLAQAGRLASDRRSGLTAAVMAATAVLAHAVLATVDVVVLLVGLVLLWGATFVLQRADSPPGAGRIALLSLAPALVAGGAGIAGVAIAVVLSDGATNMLEIGRALTVAPRVPALLSLALLVSSFAYAIGAFPFGNRLPEHAETGRASTLALVTTVPRLSAMMALVIVLKGTLFASAAFTMSGQVIAALALGSLAFGTFGMLYQSSAARLLGFAAVAQIAYPLLGAAAGDAGITAAGIHAVGSAVALGAAFIALEGVRHLRPEWDGQVSGLVGLGRQAPVTASVLALSLLSLAGLPLFAGFWGVLHVVAALSNAGLLGLALLTALSVPVAFAAVARVLWFAFFERGGEDGAGGGDHVGGFAAVPAVLLGVALLVLGVAPLVAGVASVYAVFSL